MEPDQETITKYLEQLTGVWTGEGVVEFPTIPTIPYREELQFILNEDKHYLQYEQRTCRKDQNGNETTSHHETGFWRVLQDGAMELLTAQAGGRVEVARGDFKSTEDGLEVSFMSSLIGNDPRVGQTWRVFTLRGGILRYSMKMQTTAVPEPTIHVQAQLKRG